VGGIEEVIVRTNPGVDPHLGVWEWQIPVYLFLGGLVAGLMVIGAWQELWGKGKWQPRLSILGALIALVALSVGMGALFLDLANPQYVYRFYLAFKPTSPMSWGAWVLLLAYPALALWALLSVGDERLQRWVDGSKLLHPLLALRQMALDNRRKILWSVLVVGGGLGIYTGVLLQTMVARPLWNSGLLGPLFLASGVSAGAALYMLLRAAPESFSALLKWDVGALILEGLLLGLLLIEKSGGAPMDRAAAASLLGGPYTGVFFGLVLIGGILVPLVMETIELRNPRHHSLFAPALVLVGSFSLRAVMVVAGMASGVQLLG
jgi:protein NrfD